MNRFVEQILCEYERVEIQAPDGQLVRVLYRPRPRATTGNQRLTRASSSRGHLLPFVKLLTATCIVVLAMLRIGLLLAGY